MDDMFSLDQSISCSDDVAVKLGHSEGFSSRGQVEHLVSLGEFRDETGQNGTSAPEIFGSEGGLLKAQIANHPFYPRLVATYLECQKVGAPPEIASLLEEIEREKYPIRVSGEIGADPALDKFMDSYCDVLLKYKEELSKPFDEARTFLRKIETQLSNLCKRTSSPTTTGNEQSDDAAGSSGDEPSHEDADDMDVNDTLTNQGDQELKEMLMKKYSGYLSSLRKEFLKRRKTGKLPRDARSTLLSWWSTHYRWPYPTEEEKARLAEITGLDQKQINNWFINQRKRHWKPSEEMRFALMEGVSGTGGRQQPY